MRPFLIIFAVVALTVLPGSASKRIENFALIDHEGEFHELEYYLKLPGVKGLVIFIQGNGCPLVQKRVPELNRLKDEYQRQGILFCMLNANLQDGRGEIRAEAEKFGIEMPILIDDAQIVAKTLGVERTAEAYLLNPQRRIVYRGAIDDQLDYQSAKPEAGHSYLKDAIENLISGREIDPAITEAPGCKVTFPKFSDGLTYTRDIAPILANKCVRCHTDGGLGPFAMSSYRKVLGWSDMIAEVVLTKQMPPWHADPAIGEFSNDCSLTPDQAYRLVSWVREGAPRGDGEDPLKDLKMTFPDWHLGEPDHVIDLPAQEVPAEGVIDYRYVTIDNPFDRDVWLTACEVQPGNPRVLHHVIVTSHPVGKRKESQWITGYAPGTQGQEYPAGSSVHLKKGHQLRFQLHYTVSGRPEIDRTRLGFHFSEKPTTKIFRTAVVLHRKFEIPPGDRDYQQEKELPIQKEVTVYAINPHMHFRGKWMNFEAEFPDGRREMLLSVPNYNFNWQRTYVMEEPVQLPAGSRVHIRNAWDNSSNNPYNPDPDKAVKWGEQSFDEMFFATIGYIESE